MSILRECAYLGRERLYLGVRRTSPYSGNEYCNPNMVIYNGIFYEKLFVTKIRINNAHFPLAIVK